MATPVSSDQDHGNVARITNLPVPLANLDAARAIDGGSFYVAHASHGYAVGKVLELTASGLTASLSWYRNRMRVMVAGIDGTNGYFVVSKGLVQGLSGLTTGTTYQVNVSTGALTTNRSPIHAGVALSATSLLFDGIPAPDSASDVPVGAILPYAGYDAASSPPGYEYCDGTTVSGPVLAGSEGEQLVLVIGGTYGVADGVSCSFTSGSDTMTDTTASANRFAVGQILFVATAATAIFSEIGSSPLSYAPLYVVARPTSTTYKLGLTAGGTPLVADVTRSENVFTSYARPDLKGRVVAGLDTGGLRLSTATGGFGSAAKLGNSGGAENHLLTAAQSGLPSHAHTFSSNSATNTATTGGGARITAIGAATGENTAAVAAANASAAHPNCQPTLVCNHIIRVW